MKKGVGVFKGVWIFVFGVLSFQASAGISAFRPLSEDWRITAERHIGAVPLYERGTPYTNSKSYYQIDWNLVTGVADLPTIEAAFFHVRDKRYLHSESPSEFLRRITWLFPDDGCYSRAALMKAELETMSIPVSRVFIFGELSVMTSNHPSGWVGWWYHTAPVMKTPEGEVYVLDPAIEPSRPLKIQDWVLRQVPELERASLSVCHANTYSPMDPCENPGDPMRQAHSDMRYFLGYEWERQEELGRNPEEVLGELPPWEQDTP